MRDMKGVPPTSPPPPPHPPSWLGFPPPPHAAPLTLSLIRSLDIGEILIPLKINTSCLGPITTVSFLKKWFSYTLPLKKINNRCYYCIVSLWNFSVLNNYGLFETIWQHSRKRRPSPLDRGRLTGTRARGRPSAVSNSADVRKAVIFGGKFSFRWRKANKRGY